MSLWGKAKDAFKKLTGESAGKGEGGCAHGNVPHTPGTPEFELFVAKAELKAGTNLPHGAHHLAQFISFDPNNRNW